MTCIAGWWIFVAILLETLDFPFQLPVGDMSSFLRRRKGRLTVDPEDAS